MVRVSPEVWVRERDFTGHSVLAELPVLPGEAKRGRHLLQSRAKTPGRVSAVGPGPRVRLAPFLPPSLQAGFRQLVVSSAPQASPRSRGESGLPHAGDSTRGQQRPAAPCASRGRPRGGRSATREPGRGRGRGRFCSETDASRGPGRLRRGQAPAGQGAGGALPEPPARRRTGGGSAAWRRPGGRGPGPRSGPWPWPWPLRPARAHRGARLRPSRGAAARRGCPLRGPARRGRSFSVHGDRRTTHSSAETSGGARRPGTAPGAGFAARSAREPLPCGATSSAKPSPGPEVLRSQVLPLLSRLPAPLRVQRVPSHGPGRAAPGGSGESAGGGGGVWGDGRRLRLLLGSQGCVPRHGSLRTARPALPRHVGRVRMSYESAAPPAGLLRASK